MIRCPHCQQVHKSTIHAESVSLRMVILAIAMGSLYLSSLFIIVGLTTNYWLEMRSRNINSHEVDAHFGLHRTCFRSNDICSNPRSDYAEKKNILPAIRGVVCTGAFLTVFATGLAMVIFAYDLLGITNRKLTIGTSILCFVAGLFVVIGVSLFSSDVDIDPELIYFPDNIYRGYSFGLTTTAGGMTWICTLLYIWATFLKADGKFVM